MVAADNGHADMVWLLVVKGAKCSRKNKEGYTALHLAAEKGPSTCSYKCGRTADSAKVLLDLGADVEVCRTQYPTEAASKRALLSSRSTAATTGKRNHDCGPVRAGKEQGREQPAHHRGAQQPQRHGPAIRRGGGEPWCEGQGG